MHGGNTKANSVRFDGLKIVNERAGDLLMVLVGYKAAGYFRVSLARQYRLAALARITAPYAADVKRRTAGVALQSRITFLAEDLIHADRGVVFLLVERNLGYHRTLFFRNRQHVVVETRNGDLSFLVHHFRQHLAKGIDWVFDRSAEMTGMEVPVRSVHLYLPVGKAAQTRRDGRGIFADHRGVGNKNNV